MKVILTIISTFLLITTGFSQPIKVKGSDTIYPLMTSLEEVFAEIKSNTTLEISGGGSGTGIEALINNNVQIAMSSRGLKKPEKEKLGNFGELTIAYDALSIIINPGNNVNQLTKAQLKAIFTGEIKNWKEVGGHDAPINVYTRFTNSGTYDFMIDKVLDGEKFVNHASAKSSNAGIVQSVSEDLEGIGFVGLAYVEDVVKPISVSFSGEFIRPTFKNALDRKYPISRPLYLYYKKENEAQLSSFIDFVTTPLGQEMVTHRGYIPVKI